MGTPAPCQRTDLSGLWKRSVYYRHRQSGGRTAMLKYRGYLAAIVIVYFGVVILFWLHGDPAMVGIFERAQGVPPVMGPWLYQPYAHAPVPFIDLVGIFSWRECF